jgi:hypothetical protein
VAASTVYTHPQSLPNLWRLEVQGVELDALRLIQSQAYSYSNVANRLGTGWMAEEAKGRLL